MRNPHLSYDMFDADVHYYETRDSFTRHFDRDLMHKAIQVRTEPSGEERWYVGDRLHTFFPFWSFDEVQRPGALSEVLNSIKSKTVVDDGKRPMVPMSPAFEHRAPRLALMDEQGVESALVLPTLGFAVEHFMAHDVEMTYANLRSFNRWLDEEWGFAFEGRLYTTPLMSLLDLDEAMKDLDWAISRGARVVHMRPGPVSGRSPADRYYDPFWQRMNDAGLSLAFHSSESGYNAMYSTRWGEAPDPSPFLASAWQWTNVMIERPIMETLSSLIFHNFFKRYPSIKVASIENGSGWVEYLLHSMDKGRAMGRSGPWPEGQLDDRPSRIFKQHVFISPYPEEDIVALAGLIGPTQVLAGSDYPHPEGLAEPTDFVEKVATLPADDIRRIMRDNARSLVGLPL